jgi:hypothetical protein
VDVSISFFETDESRICEKVGVTYAAWANESRWEWGRLPSVRAI